MTDRAKFSCSCGQIAGSVPRGAGHIRCYCDSCRIAELALDQSDPGKAGITVMTFPADQLEFDQGKDLLALMQVTPKGAFRWYASCCKASLFSTSTGPRLGYAALKGSAAVDIADFGREKCFVYKADASGKPQHKGMSGMIINVLANALRMNVSGRWKQSPFFDAEGAPFKAPELMPKETRKDLLARL